MTHKDDQKQEFNDRLKRIASGGPNTYGQVYCGIVDPKAATKSKTRATHHSLSFLMLIGAFILGAMAMTVGRVGAFHFLAGDALTLSEKFGAFGGFVAANMGDLVIATFLAIIFKYLFHLRGNWFHLRGNWRGTALVVGVVSMMLAELPLMARAPDAFSILFSPEFVETKLYGPIGPVEFVPELENMQDTSATMIN